MDADWSISWNAKEAQFFARFRKWDGSGWSTKRLPKSFGQSQRFAAERWMASWHEEYVRTGGLSTEPAKVRLAKNTLKTIGPRWLQYRYDDRGTKINTHKGFKESLNNWILGNPRFDHHAIDDLDMERDFTAEVCLAWINSLKGEETSRIVHVLALRTLFEDAIALGWLDPDLSNPFDRPVVRKANAQLAKAARRERTITFLTPEQVEALLTTPTRKVHDYRRLRYLVALATGLRDHELQGLVWGDIHLDGPVPFLDVQRQLDKIGAKPFVKYEELIKAGKTKTEIVATERALVSDPKKNSKRQMPLLPVVVEALRVWRTRGWKHYVGRAPAKDDPLFPSGRGNRHSPPGQFAFVDSPELLRKDLERVGQPAMFDGIDLDFHALRRTFATMLSRAGLSDAEVGELLGHGAQSVARRHYIDPTFLRRRMALVERLALPDCVQLQGVVVEVVADTRTAEVIKLPVGRSRA